VSGGKPGTLEPDRQALIWALHDYSAELSALISGLILRAVTGGQVSAIHRALDEIEQEARNAQSSRHPLAYSLSQMSASDAATKDPET
jgi:hypothetical protein